MKQKKIIKRYCHKCGKLLVLSGKVFWYSTLTGKPNRELICPIDGELYSEVGLGIKI